MLVYDTSSIQRDLRFLLGSFRTSVHVWGWRVEGPGRVGRLVTARTGRNRGVARRGVQAVSQRSTVSSVSRCTAVLRVRAYVTLVLGGREGLRGAFLRGDRSRAPSFRPPCRIADSGLWWPYFIFSDEHTGAIDPLPRFSSYFLWPSLACRALTHSACRLRKH